MRLALLLALLLTGCAREVHTAHVLVIGGRHTCRGQATLPVETIRTKCTDGREWDVPVSEVIP